MLATSAVFVSKIGAYKTALIALFFDFVASVGLAISSNIGWLFVFFVLQLIMAPLILYCFDIFLETYTKSVESTGFLRGIFLTLSTSASLFAPTVSGWILGNEVSFSKVYFLSVLYLIPVLALLMLYFRNFTDPVYQVLSLRKMYDALRVRKNVFHISCTQFLLRFYFSWMVIYLPIHLNHYMGFNWFDIGTILFLMLIPYVLIEFPAGVVADKWLGEKELLISGFLIASIFTAIIPFLETKSVIVWGLVLFMTRVGSALIEGMSETYFFKKIGAEDVSILSIFRMLHSLAYIIGPLSAGALLLFTDTNNLWIPLSIIMLFGIFSASAIKDTR
jgi:hypothetical protein